MMSKKILLSTVSVYLLALGAYYVWAPGIIASGWRPTLGENYFYDVKDHVSEVVDTLHSQFYKVDEFLRTHLRPRRSSTTALLNDARIIDGAFIVDTNKKAESKISAATPVAK